MSDIILKGVSKSYNGIPVVQDLNLRLDNGKITCLVGASGIGKTTILNIISGLTDAQGTIEGIPQDVSYIFQNPNLAPNLTVYGNLDFVLRAKIRDKAHRSTLIMQALTAVGLASRGDAYPHQLSTGMAQRVSMARAFVYPSQLILMDEPFRGLDIITKANLIQFFIALWQKSGKTVLLVTHNIDEAVLLSDKILLLSGKPSNIKAEFALSSDKASRKLSDADVSEAFGRVYDAFSGGI